MDSGTIKTIITVLLTGFLGWVVFTTNENQNRLTALEQWRFHLDRSVLKLWEEKLEDHRIEHERFDKSQNHGHD